MLWGLVGAEIWGERGGTKSRTEERGCLDQKTATWKKNTKDQDYSGRARPDDDESDDEITKKNKVQI